MPVLGDALPRAWYVARQPADRVRQRHGFVGDGCRWAATHHDPNTTRCRRCPHHRATGVGDRQARLGAHRPAAEAGVRAATRTDALSAGRRRTRTSAGCQPPAGGALTVVLGQRERVHPTPRRRARAECVRQTVGAQPIRTVLLAGERHRRGTFGRRRRGIAIGTIVAMAGPQRTKGRTHWWERPNRLVVLTGLSLLLASTTSAGSAAGSSYAPKPCGAIVVDHSRYRVFRNSTRVSCAKARRVMRQFYAGPIRSGTGNSPITLPGQPGWRCGVAAGTAICHNGLRTVRGRTS